MGLINIGAGIAAAGRSVSQFAGTAALERMKSDLEDQKIRLAEQIRSDRRLGELDVEHQNRLVEIAAGKSPSDDLQEVYDKDSPTGSKFVKKSEAAGQFGKAPASEDNVTVREINVGDEIKYGRFDKKGNLLGYVEGAGGARYKPQAPNTDPFAGKGLNAQMMNMLIKGDPATPEYAAAYAQMARPQTSFDANGSPVYVTPDMSWARKPGGAGASHLGGGVGTPQTQPQGGAQDGPPGKPSVTTGDQVKGMEVPRAVAVGNLDQAKKDVDLAQSIFFPNGKFDRVTTGTSGVPLTKGRTGAQAIRRSIEVLLRLRTGAAAPESEVNNYANMFSPSALDTNEAAATKMKRLQEFYSGVENSLGSSKPADGSAPPKNANAGPAGHATSPAPHGQPKTLRFEDLP